MIKVKLKPMLEFFQALLSTSVMPAKAGIHDKICAPALFIKTPTMSFNIVDTELRFAKAHLRVAKQNFIRHDGAPTSGGIK